MTGSLILLFVDIVIFAVIATDVKIVVVVVVIIFVVVIVVVVVVVVSELPPCETLCSLWPP